MTHDNELTKQYFGKTLNLVLKIFILNSIVFIQVHCGDSRRLQSWEWIPVTALHVFLAAICVPLPALRGDSTALIFLICCHQKSCLLAADILGLLGPYCLYSPPYFCVEESPLFHIQQAFSLHISESFRSFIFWSRAPFKVITFPPQLLTCFLAFRFCHILQNTGFCRTGFSFGLWPKSGLKTCFALEDFLRALRDFQMYTFTEMLGIYFAGCTLPFNNFHNLFTKHESKMREVFLFFEITWGHNFIIRKKECVSWDSISWELLLLNFKSNDTWVAFHREVKWTCFTPWHSQRLLAHVIGKPHVVWRVYSVALQRARNETEECLHRIIEQWKTKPVVPKQRCIQFVFFPLRKKMCSVTVSLGTGARL